MGLAMDADGIPLHYELFPGNTVDKETFRPVIGEIRRNYDTGRIIVVADMGIITGDNIFYLQGKEKGRILTVMFSVFRSGVAPRLLRNMCSPMKAM
jgi:transposase